MVFVRFCNALILVTLFFCEPLRLCVEDWSRFAMWIAVYRTVEKYASVFGRGAGVFHLPMDEEIVKRRDDGDEPEKPETDPMEVAL